MGYVIGFDLGTSYIKCSIFDRHGRCLSVGRVPAPTHREGGLHVVKPNAFWSALSTCLVQAHTESGVLPSDIDAISYASQANSFIVLDADGTPLTDIILWTTEFEKEMPEDLSEVFTSDTFLEQSGMGAPSAGILLAKLHWMNRNQGQLVSRADRILTIAGFLVYGLTGRAVIDTSSTSLTGLLNIKTQKWNTSLCNLINIQPEKLGFPVPVGTQAGTTSTHRSSALGFKNDTPVFAGGLDHLAASYGAGLGAIGNISESTGTVLAAITLNTDSQTRKNIIVGPTLERGVYSHLCFSPCGAGIIEQFHDRYTQELDYQHMFALADDVSHSAAELGIAPDSDSLLDQVHAHISKSDIPLGVGLNAVLEIIAYRSLRLIRQLTPGIGQEAVLATGGGSRSKKLLKIKADMTGVPLKTCQQQELGTFGAAMIAACGLGWFDSLQDVQTSWVQVTNTIQPDLQHQKLYKEWMGNSQDYM
jgi:xylulokinase